MGVAEMVGVVFAGLGLFFVGVKLIGAHLSQMTGRGFRKWILRLVDRPWAASLLGGAFGALTQSTNAVTFIVTSMITAGLMPVPKAMPVIIWANLGTSALVLLATVNIHLLVLYLLGSIGLAYFLNIDKSSRYRHAAAALLGVALLFLGLDFVKQGAAPLREMPAVRELLSLAAQSYGLMFALGAGLTLIAQSSATVTVVAVTMTTLGLLSMDQTLMVIYGAGLGSAASLWFMTTNLVGTARQLAYVQIFLKTISAVAMVGLFVLEQGLDLPLVKWLTGQMAEQVSARAAWAYLLMQAVGCLIVTALSGPVYRLALRWSPATHEEILSKPQYLYEQALDDAETALDLVEKEQLRQLRCLPDYLPGEEGRLAAGDAASGDPAKLHAANRSVTAEIGAFLTDLMDRHQDRGALERMLNLQARNRLLGDLQDGLHQLHGLLPSPQGGRGVDAVSHGIVEGLHFMVLALLDALISQDPQDRALLLTLVSDKTEVMERVRHQLLREGHAWSSQVHETLFMATSLFERMIWVLRQYGLLLNGSGEPGASA